MVPRTGFINDRSPLPPDPMQNAFAFCVGTRLLRASPCRGETFNCQQPLTQAQTRRACFAAGAAVDFAEAERLPEGGEVVAVAVADAERRGDVGAGAGDERGGDALAAVGSMHGDAADARERLVVGGVLAVGEQLL